MRIQRRFHRILPKSRPGMIHRPTRPAALGTAVIPPVRAAVSRTVKMTTAQAGARGTDPAADRETAVTPVLAEGEARAMTITTTTAGVRGTGLAAGQGTVGIPVLAEVEARAMTIMTTTAIAVEAETVEAAVAVQGVVEAAADDHQLCLTHNAG